MENITLLLSCETVDNLDDAIKKYADGSYVYSSYSVNYVIFNLFWIKFILNSYKGLGLVTCEHNHISKEKKKKKKNCSPVNLHTITYVQDNFLTFWI